METMKDYTTELEASFQDMHKGDCYEWDKLNELMESKETITVVVTEVIKGGVVAYVEGIRGFIPASKLSLNYVSEEDLATYRKKELQVRVIDADEEAKRLILSAKELLKEEADAKLAEKLSMVKEGAVMEGVVESLQKYGAFVDLGNGLSGLLHISQISTKRIKHPGVVLSEGQAVTVKVLSVNDGKISLSMKALEEIKEEEAAEETFELPKSEEVSTSLGALLANIKLS